LISEREKSKMSALEEHGGGHLQGGTEQKKQST
jgi:hypothetical protein